MKLNGKITFWGWMSEDRNNQFLIKIKPQQLDFSEKGGLQENFPRHCSSSTG